MISLQNWENTLKKKAQSLYSAEDPAHDLLHVYRVVSNALKLAPEEGADLEVIIPAAYLHDFENVPKDSPQRHLASKLSAEQAIKYLKSINYPIEHLNSIYHAIEAHSFSANIKPETLEAEIIQDADRLDALGAIGIARCFSTSALMNTPYYSLKDPWAENRELNDKEFGIDHFFIKLFKIAETMNTQSATKEAENRVVFMRNYLETLKKEI